ncbi:PhnE/PtxC family ABC transporter permease [Saccharothrix syringae]|uniref:ABC transporter permease subunit n=1 Tax=Saccharothrix syringae TaxID=103733 RepID=A0A5Q0GWF7_SACSY|nr:ABC transporter permease subunit [Saccharothrix syringae]QFZ18319.1 ABC transporter permease subunit [Saccharothrix syringae]
MTLATRPPGELVGCRPTGAVPRRPGPRRRARRWWLLACAAAVVAAALPAFAGGTPVVRVEGLGQLGEFFAAAAHPRLDGPFAALVAGSAATTLAYAVLGTAVSLVIGLVGGVLTSQVWWRVDAPGRRVRDVLAWGAARLAFVVPRGVHEVVWGLGLLVVLGRGPVVAVLAIGIPFGAVTAKVFAELLDEADRAPYEALLAAGAPRPVAVLHGLLPAALGDLLSYAFYRLECAIRSATALGLVGAGGLGTELLDSFRALVYGEMWTLLYALVVLSAVADGWSTAVRARLAGPRGRPDPLVAGSVVLVPALVACSAWWVRLDPSVLWDDRSAHQALVLARQSWPPAAGEGGIAGLVRLCGTTLAMSVLAVAVAFVLGALLALPAAALPQLDRTGAARLRRLPAVLLARSAMLLLRAVPPPVWALLALFAFHPGVVPGAVALGAYTAGVLGRLMAEAVDNLDGRPLRALGALGASRGGVLCYGVLPAAAGRFAAYGLYRWEVTVRETVVVGVVGAGGLGVVLQHQLNSFHFDRAAATVLAVVALTAVVDLVSAAVRRSVR